VKSWTPTRLRYGEGRVSREATDKCTCSVLQGPAGIAPVLTLRRFRPTGATRLTRIPTRLFCRTVGLWMAPCHIRGVVADRTSYLTEKTGGGRSRARTADLLLGLQEVPSSNLGGPTKPNP
jgi:hypothetical protein